MTTEDSSRTTLTADVVVVGGGIAGLWVHRRLSQAGYRVWLLETDALGAGQSIASQGIIHGGLKYALDGNLSPAAQVIAGMPARWADALAGTGDLDLRGCRLASPHFFMWSDGSVRSRLKGFLGSRALRGRVATVPPGERPTVFGPESAGTLYRLPDFVIDTENLLQHLRGGGESLLRIDPGSSAFTQVNGEVTAVSATCDARPLTLHSKAWVLCAGAGNRDLLTKAGATSIGMQTRPLHMVMVKGRTLPDLFVHCVGNDFSLTPQLTVTTHRHRDGSLVWYLGGALAETGVERSTDAQIDAARRVVQTQFPACDLADTTWGTLHIDRAEAQIDGSRRPDTAITIRQGNLWACWPTKFTLSPTLADQVLAELTAAGIAPRQDIDPMPVRPAGLPIPSVATPPWETL